MKNYLKALIALILVLACAIACVSCGSDDTTDNSGNEGNGSTNGEDDNVVKPPVGDNEEIEEETYRIRFVYSYTAKVVNDNGRTENKKEVVTVKSLYVKVDNNGLSAENLKEIADLTYNGYSFASWHGEWDKDTQTAVDANVDFASLGKITKDLTFYGERGNLAGPDVTWEVVYQYPELEEGEDAETVEPNGATLYIKGSGKMFEFANGNEIDVKWFKDYKLINTVVIQDGITSIGSNSFKNFAKLTTVMHFSEVDADGNPVVLAGFPDSITEIGDSAFMGTSLKKLTTPKSLTVIQKNAFANTTLKEVTLNEGLVTLANQAFYGSNKISSVVVPSTLKSIGNSAFHAGAGNSSHNLNNGKVYYMGNEEGYQTIDISMDNQPFDEFATTYYYIATPANYGEADYVEIIGNFWHYADDENKAHPVQYCYTLSYTNDASKTPFTSLSVPARPQYDENGDPIVDDEGVPILKGTITEEIYNAHKNLRYNGYTYASFSGGTAITVGSVINGDISYKCVRGDILSEDGGIKFTCVDGVINIYKDETTEDRIKADVAATIKSEIKKALTAEEIADLDEDGIAALVDTKFAAEEYQTEFNKRVADRLAVAFKIWDFKTTTDTGLLWNGGLSNLPKIKSVVIGEGVEYIGALTFTSLSSITEVIIPASVKAVDATAFSGCSNLVSVYYKASVETDCPTLSALATRNTGVYSYVEGSTATTGKYWTIVGESSLAWELDVEKGTLTIGGDNVMVDFESADAAPWYVAKDSITSVKIANNITSVGKNILNGYESVVSLSLPQVLQVIPESAFIGTGILNDTSKYDKGLLIVDKHLLKVDATRRDEVLFEAPYGIYTIADGAFAGCSSIKRLYLPKTVSRINPDAFPDSDLEYIFAEGDEIYWETIKAYVDFGDANVLHRSDKRPTANVLDENGKPTGRIEYVNGKHWKKVGSEYVIWGCVHVWSDWVTTKEATCYSEGTSTRFCIYDKTHTENQAIPEVAHDYGEYIADNNQTCQIALTESAECTNEKCGSVDTRDVLVPAVDENGDPILDEEGNQVYNKVYGTCNFEGADYVENDDRTCITGMTATANCLNEGCTNTDTVEVKDKPALGHIGANDVPFEDADYVFVEGSATCQKPYGIMVKACARNSEIDGFDCGYELTVDATAEDVGENYVPQTCVFDQKKVEAKYLAAAATKTSPALYYMSCKWCGAAGTETFANGEALTYYDFENNMKASDLCSASANYAFDPSDVSTAANYFKITSLADDASNKVLLVGRGANAAGWGLGSINNKGTKSATDAVYVIDTDFMVDSYTFSGSDNWITRMSLYSSAKFATIYFRTAGTNAVALSVAKDENGGEKSTGITLNVGTMYNIRLEYDVAGKTLTITATEKDNVQNSVTFTYADFVPTKSTASFESIKVEMRASTDYTINTKFVIDNLFFGAVSYADLYGERVVAD